MTKTVIVTQEVEVTVDSSKFTQDFMKSFREHFYPFTSIEEHMAHIAQCYARGLVTTAHSTLEGYGPLTNFGVRFKVTPGETIIR